MVPWCVSFIGKDRLVPAGIWVTSGYIETNRNRTCFFFCSKIWATTGIVLMHFSFILINLPGTGQCTGYSQPGCTGISAVTMWTLLKLYGCKKWEHLREYCIWTRMLLDEFTWNKLFANDTVGYMYIHASYVSAWILPSTLLLKRYFSSYWNLRRTNIAKSCQWIVYKCKN